jgi:NAD(P)-dependent dehydrogenase (short-subunit alcohol dehydrogenase family)
MLSFDLSGRTALVTGASSGIGRHFAKRLAEHGANVVAAARRLTLLQDVCDEILASGGNALAVSADTGDEAAVKRIYDAAEERFGVVDTIVANAGINNAGSSLGIDDSAFAQVLDINVRGVFLTAREGARRLVGAGSAERNHGRVVIVSSITAFQVSAGLAAYSASKAGVTQLGKVLARDWANKGVNVNVICPGYMATDMTDELFAVEKGKALLAGFPRRRMLDVSALDPMLLYLCSDASAQVTGSVFTIDDGQTL